MEWTKEKLQTRFPAKVREERLAEGLDPDVRPTREWLRVHGYSGIEGFARRNEMSVAEVLEDICGFEPSGSKPLGIRDAETCRLIEEWLEREEDLFNQWNDTRIRDARTHFRTLAKVAYKELGSTDLLRLFRADPPADTDLILRLFAGLSAHMETQGAQSNYTRSLERWADYLKMRDEIDDHKVGQVREMMSYTYERRSPEHKLTTAQIQKLWQATETLEEKVLLVILTASGTRRSEPTDCRISQLRLDRDDPYIIFDETRKTGAATVPIMAGVEVIEEWLEHLNGLNYWDGEWLFPSKKSRDGSRHPSWVNKTIKRLVTRAEVAFPDGEEPTAKSFRSFWYSRYSSARQEWLIHVQELADEQGVASSEIIDLHYLTGEGERDHFRRFAQSYFTAVFGKHLVHGFDGVREAREEERDEFTQKAIDDYFDEIRDEVKTGSTNEDDPTEESLAAMDPVSTITKARLRVEHASAAASDKVAHYPPSLKRAAGLAVIFGTWAVVFGTFWAYTGVFTINPLSNEVTATPGAIIGLLLGAAFISTNLPDLDRVEPESQRI